MNPSSSNNSNNINNNGRGSSGGVDGTQPPEPSIAAASARTHASAASATSAAYDGAENSPTDTENEDMKLEEADDADGLPMYDYTAMSHEADVEKKSGTDANDEMRLELDDEINEAPMTDAQVISQFEAGKKPAPKKKVELDEEVGPPMTDAQVASQFEAGKKSAAAAAPTSGGRGGATAMSANHQSSNERPSASPRSSLPRPINNPRRQNSFWRRSQRQRQPVGIPSQRQQTTTTATTDIENPPSDDYAPVPPAQAAEQTAAAYDRMDAAMKETQSLRTDPPLPPAQIGNQYNDMENAIKETVEDNEDDVPLHHSTADAGIDYIDEENQNQKPRAKTGAYENDDDAAQMAAVTPPPVGRDADTRAQSPPSTSQRSLFPFPLFSRPSPPADPVPTSTPASSTPPSNTAPPTLPREPSVPMLEATLVPNMPVYDGVEVIEVEEVQQSWLKRNKKYIFGAILGGAVATGAFIFTINDEFVPSGSPTVSGSPSSSSPPSDSSSPSEDPSLPPSLPPSVSDSTAPSEDPSLPPSLPPSVSSRPSYRPSSWPSPSPSFSPSSPPSLWPSSPPSTYWSSLNWNQEGQDINGESSNDWLGRAVALSADGTIMAVGAPGNWFDDDRLGHVKIFFREGKGSSWEQRGDTLYGESNGDAFGSSVSLSGDGNTLFIGAPYNDGNGQYSGSVAVYRWDGVTLNYKQRGDALRGEAKYDQFGISLDLSSDGEVLAVGSPYTDSNGPFSGRVQVYAWDLVSSTYEQLGQAINGSAAGDSFGRSVSLSGDGTKLAVGAEENDSNGEDSGQVRLFELNESDMSYKPLGDPLNGDAPGDWFGSSVSLSDDGTTLAIGALFNAINGNDSGQVKIFKFDDTTVNFKQRGPSLYGIAAEDRFGYSVVLSSDGNTLVVGASQRYADKPGFVKAFRLDEDALVYKQLGQTLNGNGSGDQFGYAVALSEDDKTLAVGAPFNDEDGVDSGEAKMYNIDLSAPPPSTHPSESFSPTMLPTSPPSTHPSESFSPSMSPTSPPSTHPSKSFSPTETCYWIDVSVVFDEYSDETSWDVQRINDVGANIVVKAYNGIDDDANTLRKESMCLEEGQYEFTIYDSCGDGLVSDFDYDDDYIYNISVPGHYNVTSYGELIVEGAKFDHSEATLFSLPLPSAPSASP